MKRSEIIKLIEQDVDSERVKTLPELISDILESAENLGMNPPHCINKEGIIYLFDTWEPED